MANWMKQPDCPTILICAPSNTAADLIAQRLQGIPSLQNKFIRFTTEKTEDIFNIDVENLKSYELAYKNVFMSEQMRRSLGTTIMDIDKRTSNILEILEY